MLCVMLAFCYTGDDPLLSQMMPQHKAPLEMEPPKKQLEEQATVHSS